MTTEAPSGSTAIVLLGGETVDIPPLGTIPADSLVVAADSGVEVAQLLGLKVDVVVGDMDSISPTALSALRALGTEVVRHPADKSESDAELALRFVRDRGVRRVILVGGGGGRLDHQLALFAVMFIDELRDARVEARLARSRAYAVRDGATISIACELGDNVGLLPFGGDAHEVTTSGLQWALSNDSLRVAASRGISNRAISTDVRVSVGSGRLIVTVDSANVQGVAS
ncbi:MAG: thiamine diphosphokinase [Ilumatobacteraceae bacterium]|jgi:thiamine pyrophosphokinase